MASGERAAGAIDHGSSRRNLRTNSSSSVDPFVRRRFSRTMVRPILSRYLSQSLETGNRQVVQIDLFGYAVHLIHHGLTRFRMNLGHMYWENRFDHFVLGKFDVVIITLMTERFLTVTCGLGQLPLQVCDRMISGLY